MTVRPPVPWIVPEERLKFATETSVSTSRYMNSALTWYWPAPESTAPGARIYGVFAAEIAAELERRACGHVERAGALPGEDDREGAAVDGKSPGVIESRRILGHGSGAGVDRHRAGVRQGAAGGEKQVALELKLTAPPERLSNVPGPAMLPPVVNVVVPGILERGAGSDAQDAGDRAAGG